MTIDALIIGSGAGGAVTALRLAEKGLTVAVLEEGPRNAEYGQPAPEAMATLYRSRGMTPIVGRAPIGYVEGCCVGGSTELNSGFWHRTPREILRHWAAGFDLQGASPDTLTPHFSWAEERLGVGPYGEEWPASTKVFARGMEAMDWTYTEVPRAAPGCRGTNLCASGCPTRSKRGMSISLLPEAEKHGAQVLTGYRADFLIRDRHRVCGVVATRRLPEGGREQVRIDADFIFVCCGPTESPALLRRSGFLVHIGNSLRIHPMLKVVAEYDEVIDAHTGPLPLIQVKEFWPDISMGGAYFSLGHLALGLGENWPDNRHLMEKHRHLASYYVAVRGSGIGSVRPGALDHQSTFLKYEMSNSDVSNLSVGLARLSLALLAGGAKAVYPAVAGMSPLKDERTAAQGLTGHLPLRSLAATTVHAFSSCPMGERADLCAVDSFGKVPYVENLYVNDASILPDSPGVNPQGSVMAFASRNAQMFLENAR